ncbi:MAG: SUMF1/EgtB/PvdO family nonheme iron enzyme [Hyphomicrobiaceae bacterium]|nr:SUMF1/EgtB/PvdO family nonheme iron enzyme [Hyphomicrobiaceae bacterium]
MKRFAACIFCIFLALLAVSPVFAQQRVALVIGNSAYSTVGKLINPGKDARSIAATFLRMGYDVTQGYDLNRAAMRRAVVTFGHKARRADLAVIYFAGHGIEVNGENWLLPVDTRLSVDVDVEDEALALSFVMNKLRTTNRLGLIILDACRNNPFLQRMTRSAHLTRAVKNGLARVEPKGNVLVAYAAREGTRAYDGRGANSPYAAALLKHLQTPGLDVRLLFGRIRDEVRRTTQRLQSPHIYGSLGGEEIALQKGGAVGKNRYAALERENQKLKKKLKGQISKGAERDMTVPLAPIVPKEKSKSGLWNRWFGKEKKLAIGAFPANGSASRHHFIPGTIFDDCNGAGWCPSMVVVSKGSFLMGSSSGDNDEKPVRWVTIGKPFAVGRFEVTFKEWGACVSGGGCKGYQPKDQGWGKGKRPVINVSRNDARTYLKWLKKKTGKSYRLLSEAEWEYVARAGTTGAFSWPDKISTAKANYDGTHTYDGSFKGNYRKETVPVDSFEANAFGLYNVHGNVWEWVEDCYKGSYEGAPVDGSAITTEKCLIGVLRGGSWANYPAYLRSANRYWYKSVDRYDFVGFRVARSL